MEDLDPNSLDKLRVVDLRKHLSARGLPTSCLKADLVRRLREDIEKKNVMKQRFYGGPTHIYRNDDADLMEQRWARNHTSRTDYADLMEQRWACTHTPRTYYADLMDQRSYGTRVHIPRTDNADILSFSDLMDQRSYGTRVHTPRTDNAVLESTEKLEKLKLESSVKGCDCVSKPREPCKMVLDYKDLFLKHEDCDTVIKVKGQEFPAHRIILKTRSPVFASTFRNDMKEKATGIVEIEDCDPTSFSDFLCFLYCGYLENLSTKNVFSLFTTADKYDVQDLRSECLEFMKKNLSMDTLWDSMTLALLHCEKELIEIITNFFGKNYQKIIVTDEWKSFLAENLTQGTDIMIKALIAKKK